jgi:chemotaxis-related protein WspB
MLIFYVGKDLYAIDSSQVVEIIPKVSLRKIYQAPEYVAGIFNYKGVIVPVIDLCQLIQKQPSRSFLSTRIIMVNYVEQNGVDCWLGLMAERVTETLNKSDISLVDTKPLLDEAPYLGEIIMDEKGMIQRIRLEYLLLDSQQKFLLNQESQ